MAYFYPENGQSLRAVVTRTDLPPRLGKVSLPIAHALDPEGRLTTFRVFVQDLPKDTPAGTAIEVKVVRIDRNQKHPRWAYVYYVKTVEFE